MKRITAFASQSDSQAAVSRFGMGTKRVLAILLTLIMITALVGCGGRKRKPIELTLSTEDSVAILAAAGIRLPEAEVAPGAGTEVKWFSWGDPFQNYDSDQIVNTGFYTFREKYGGSLKWVETTYQEHNDRLAQLILANDCPDVMPGGSNSCAFFPSNCLKEMIQPCDPWIDYDDPLWAPMKDLAELFAFGDHHYQICIKTAPADVVPYNRRILEDWGFDDPAELYYNDMWTWETFYDMCLEFTDPDANRYALDGYAYTSMFLKASGEHFLMHTAEDGYWLNIDSPAIERGMQYLYEINKNDLNYRGANGERWDLRGDNDPWGAGVKDGLCLFYIIGESFFRVPPEEMAETWGDTTEFMFAPLPRDEQGDGVYYNWTTFDGLDSALGIVQGATNPEGAALLAACMRFKFIDPIVQQIDENQLRNVYLWTDEMLDMSKETRRIAEEHILIDPTFNLGTELDSIANGFMGDSIVRSNTDMSWAKLKEDNGEALEYRVEELNAKIDAYLEKLESQG